MTDTLQEFRDRARAWLAANCPAEMRLPVEDDDDICWGGRNFAFKSPAQRAWLEAMGARGWTVPEWPTEYGGGGLSKDEAKVLAQELRRIDARSPLSSFGIWMLGPALLKYGNEAQKHEHLPKIARGEIRWCQGYSEPGQGPTSRACGPARCSTATIMSSTARRCGPATPIIATGSSAWFAPTRPRPSISASASCCSTWRRPASAPRRSS